MESNTIKVHVIGKSAAGKSTIATIIANALRKENLEYSRIVEFENDLEDIPQKVKSLREKNTVIEIVEEHPVTTPSWIKRNLTK